jgi:hypothetical protein
MRVDSGDPAGLEVFKILMMHSSDASWAPEPKITLVIYQCGINLIGKKTDLRVKRNELSVPVPGNPPVR